MTITVNGIQKKAFTFGPGLNFNFGVLRPILLPMIDNHFRVALHLPCAGVVITHLVLDDQVIMLS